MIKKVIAVYDLKAKIYFAPGMFNSIGEGIRSFSDAVNDKASGTLNRHPEDFLLFELADFDDVSGSYVSKVPPLRLGIGTDFVEVSGGTGAVKVVS